MDLKKSTSNGVYRKYVAKGTGVRNMRMFVDQQTQIGVFDEKMKAIEPNYSKAILHSVWYNAYDIKVLTEQVSDELGWTLRKFCLEFNEFSLKQDLSGLYKFFLKVGEPARVLSSAPRLVKTYTNSLTYEISANEKGVHKGIVRAPEVFAEWNLNMFEGFINGVLKTLEKRIDSFEVFDRNYYQEEDGTWIKYSVCIIYSDLGSSMIPGTFQKRSPDSSLTFLLPL
ncbi:MAG: hypothetical protein RIM99_01720 [Cyclobacteriaceae bacterium]